MDVDCSLCQLRQRLEQHGSDQDMREKWMVANFTTATSSLTAAEQLEPVPQLSTLTITAWSL